VWGNLGSTLWFASSIVIGIPLINVIATPVSRILSFLFGSAGQMAAESLFRSRTRTGVTVAAIALVYAFAVLCASVAYSHRSSVNTYFTSGFLASDLAVSAMTTEGGWLETPLAIGLEDKIRDVAGVRTTETLRIVPGMMYQGERIAVAALSDGMLDPSRTTPRWYRAGDPVVASAAVRAGEGILVSVSFADRFGVGVGTPLELDTPTGLLSLPIVGVVPDYISDRGAVAISRKVFEQRWQDSTANWFFVFTEHGSSPSDVRDRLLEALGNQYLLKILSPAEGMEYLGGEIDKAYQFTQAIQLLVIIITVAGIFDLLIAAVWERRRELALWRLIGADNRPIRRSVIIESATVGTLGAVLGLLVGVITTWNWINVNYRYVLGYNIEFHFDFWAARNLFVLVIVMTVVAGYLAARHATRQPVLDGLQVE
jgi:putative ABC transport system permease protein